MAKITFELDGRMVEAEEGETIWQVADRHKTKIPHLCWLPEPGYRADGNCRACMVEIKGERVLAPSCCRGPAKDMEVSSVSPRAVHSIDREPGSRHSARCGVIGIRPQRNRGVDRADDGSGIGGGSRLSRSAGLRRCSSSCFDASTISTPARSRWDRTKNTP